MHAPFCSQKIIDNMKNGLLLALLLFGLGMPAAQAQSEPLPPLDTAQLRTLRQHEDTLQMLSYYVLRGKLEEDRFFACQNMIKTFVTALRTPNSFQYPFDSLRRVSFLYPPDSSFRIFTWQLYVDADTYRYYGAIQMRSGDLQLFPLIDRSEVIEDAAEHLTTSNRDWYGALYYSIRQEDAADGKRYYTLFGFDNHRLMTRRKLIDVLTFDENGQPQFGAPIFTNDLVESEPRVKHRVILEYSAEGSIACNYSHDYGMIIFDNLIQISGSLEGQGMMNVSDGSYRGYKFDGGRWVYIDKVFNDFQEEAPREQPILDNRDDGLFGPSGKRKKNK